MHQLLVVQGNGTDIVIRSKGAGKFLEVLSETPGGSLLFVLDGVARTYCFNRDTSFANKHEILAQLRTNQYHVRGTVQFICDALHETFLKVEWSKSGKTPTLWIANQQYRLFRLVGSQPLKVDTSPYLERFAAYEVGDSTMTTLKTVVNGFTIP